MAIATIRGYRKKPSLIYFIAFTYMIIPFLMVLEMLAEVNFSFNVIRPFIFSQFFLHELFCCVTAALAVFVVTRLSFLYFVCLSIYSVGLKLVHLNLEAGIAQTFDVMVVVVWTFITIVFLTTTLRIPYLNPQARWWLRPSRNAILIRGVLLAGGVKFPVVTLNFSSGGAFIKLDERLFQISNGIPDKRHAVPTGNKEILLSAEELLIARKQVETYPDHLNQKVHLSLETLPSLDNPFANSNIEVEAEVVWVTKITDPYHHGLGLKFVKQTFSDKQKLKRYVKIFQDSELATSAAD